MKTPTAEEQGNARVARIAAAIGEHARARMLYCLMDGHARTGTELAIVAEVGASTTSAHLDRLKTDGLVKVLVQGRHRYYSLAGSSVAVALEALNVLAGGSRAGFVTATPEWLRAARTCYDHMAGSLGVKLHDRLHALGWLAESAGRDGAYDVTPRGESALEGLGIDVRATRGLRRRFAYACVDWSERRPHVGGALGAALLHIALKRRWVEQDPGGRSLEITRQGRREMQSRLGLAI
jgi:DNA-binding transcriptional ArsR family regulator